MNAQLKSDSASGDVGQVLAEILQDGIDIHRCAAARGLKQIADKNAVGPLTKALLDEDEDVRTDAASALDGIADSAACARLLANLVGDPNGEVKLAAIDALVSANYSDVVPLLRRLVVGRDEEVIWDEDDIIAGGWDDWADVQMRAIAGLGTLGIADAVGDIVDAIHAKDQQDVSEAACKALANMGSDGTAALFALLDDKDERFRRRAAARLATLDTDDAAAALAKAIEDPAASVRLAVANHLAARNPANPHLQLLLLDGDPTVREVTLRLCGAHHPERLELLLADNNIKVRRAALDVLVSNPHLLDAGVHGNTIEEIIEGQDGVMAGFAAQAYGLMDPKKAEDRLVAAVTDTETPLELRIGAVKGLSHGEGEAVSEAMVTALNSDERQLRVAALTQLLAMASKADWPNVYGAILIAASKGDLLVVDDGVSGEDDPADQIENTIDATDDAGEKLEFVDHERDDAADDQGSYPVSTLGSMLGIDAENVDVAEAVPVSRESHIGPEDLEFLSIAQNRKKVSKKRLSPDAKIAAYEDVPILAARLLGDLPRDGVSAALAEYLGSKDAEVVRAAAESLASLAQAGIAFDVDIERRLIAALAHSDRGVRLAAIRALAAAKCEMAVMQFINMLTDTDSFIRAECVHALARLDAVAHGVRELLNDPEPPVRLAAAKAVAGSGGADVVNLLGEFAMAFEAYHGREAAELIRKINPTEGNAFFFNVLADEQRKRFWQVAIEALGELNDASRADEPALVSAGHLPTTSS